MGYFPGGYFPGVGTATVYEWPDPDPDGPLMKPLAKLASLLAMVPAFQIRCGLSGSDALGAAKLLNGEYGVKQRIFYPMADPDYLNVFPSAELYFGDDFSYEQIAGGHHNYLWPAGGTVDMILVDKDKHPKDLPTSTRDFGVYVGTLLRELREQAGRNDELSIVGIKQKQKPMLCPITEETQRGRAYWHTVWTVEWQ